MKRLNKELKLVKDLVPLFYNLAVASVGLNIVSGALLRLFAEEIKLRLLEFKLMNVIEIEKRDKKIKIEYHKLKGIKKYIKQFLKENPKWKAEEEVYAGIETGRIILTRVYRNYHKKRDEDEDYCCECGRELE